MPSSTSSDAGVEADARSVERFSLVAGGPLFQLFLRTRLARPQLELVQRRMLLFAALAWLPLLGLTLQEGTALGGVTEPFLTDVDVYARFLVALPILFLAEPVVHERLRLIIAQLRDCSIVTAASRSEFEQAIESAMKLRDSVTAELVLVVLVLVASWISWKHGVMLHADTWYAQVKDEHVQLTGAGKWFACVSVPIFQFLLLRWYYRLAIWWRFLWQVSRLSLELKALHPDRAGGIGFLSNSIVAFMPVLVAQSVVVSGIIFSRVLPGTESVMDFRGVIIALIVFLIVQILGPLLFFVRKLGVAQRSAMHCFGVLATAYAREFEQKWLNGRAPDDESLLGSSDIQSLNDLSGSYDMLHGMRTVPFSMRELVRLVLAVSAPLFPLVLTVISFSELMKDLLAMLL